MLDNTLPVHITSTPGMVKMSDFCAFFFFFFFFFFEGSHFAYQINGNEAKNTFQSD